MGHLNAGRGGQTFLQAQGPLPLNSLFTGLAWLGALHCLNALHQRTLPWPSPLSMRHVAFAVVQPIRLCLGSCPCVSLAASVLSCQRPTVLVPFSLLYTLKPSSLPTAFAPPPRSLSHSSFVIVARFLTLSSSASARFHPAAASVHLSSPCLSLSLSVQIRTVRLDLVLPFSLILALKGILTHPRSCLSKLPARERLHHPAVGCHGSAKAKVAQEGIAPNTQNDALASENGGHHQRL